jgi:hypothetical protein
MSRPRTAAAGRAGIEAVRSQVLELIRQQANLTSSLAATDLYSKGTSGDHYSKGTSLFDKPNVLGSRTSAKS